MPHHELVAAIALGAALGFGISYLTFRKELQASKAVVTAAAPATVAEMEEAALKKMRSYVGKYYSFIAGDKITKEHCERAFRDILLNCRILRNVSTVDTRITLFSKVLDSPVMIAPTGFHRLIDTHGEAAVARAASKCGVAYTYNFVFSTVGIEEVAAASGSGVLLGSIYILKDREFTLFGLREMERLGFSAVVVTCDHPHNRVKDSTVPAFEASGDDVFLNDVMVFPNARRFLQQRGETTRRDDSCMQNDDTITWDDVKWLISNTSLPVILKGVTNVADALQAVRVGASGVIVSNHGGRQMDSIPSAISLLPEIVKAVGSKMTVFVDSGFRTGTHVLKALALGARGVFVGRPILWGLAYNGQEGVEQVLNMLKNELVYDMKSTGCCTLSEINPEIIYTK